MSYTRVTKSHPCPVCKKPDWCRVFADGWVECMRVQSDHPAKSGGWMHLAGRAAPCAPFGRTHGAHGVTRPTLTINATKLMREWAAATAPSALAELATALGLSTASVTAVGAAWAAPHAAWAFPMHDGHGNVVGIRLRNERGKFAVRGSRQGIFLNAERGARSAERTAEETANVQQPRGEHRAGMPGEPAGRDACATGDGDKARGDARPTLFVCEGPTDTAAAIELGLFAVGRPNCCCGGAEIKVYARRHGCRDVVLIADNDKPGLDGARKVGGELKLPFAIYLPPAKDLREFLRLGGTRAMIENTLKGLIWQNG